MRTRVLAAFAASSLLMVGAPIAAAATNTTAGARPVITTIAGGDGGPALATSVSVESGWDVTASGSITAVGGSVYVSSDGVIWRLDPSTDLLTPVAGVGITGGPVNLIGDSRDGVPALRATMASSGAGGDASGNLLEADTGSNRVRVVAASTGVFFGQKMTAGDVYTIAGTGTRGFAGDGGPAVKARLSGPRGVTTDRSGNVVISDTGNNRVRVVAEKTGTFYGTAMRAGDIYTVFTGTAASKLNSLVVDKSGNLIVADPGGGSVLVVAEKTGTFYGLPMTAGGVYPVVSIDTLSYATVALDRAGNVVISDTATRLLQVLAASSGHFYGQSMIAGKVYQVAGGGTSTADGVPALQATMIPTGVTVDRSGNLLIADFRNNQIRVVAASTGTFYGKSMTAGDIYTVAGNGSYAFSGDGGPATRAQLFDNSGTAVDANGNILIADTWNGRVRVLAEKTGIFYGQQMTKGDIYTIATGLGPAGFGWLTSVAVDSAGNIIAGPDVIAEKSGIFYGKEMVPGHVYTVGPDTGTPMPAQVDRNGNLVYSIFQQNFWDVRYGQVEVLAVKTGTFYGVAMTAGKLYTVAGVKVNSDTCTRNINNGVPAVKTAICGPVYAAADRAGNLVLADASDNLVRVLAGKSGTFYGKPMKVGDLYSIAGSGTKGASGNGGPALKAKLSNPGGVALDSSGNIIIADTGNNQIRVVAEKTGTFYGVAMTARDIYRIAGTGQQAFGGDGGLALNAWFNNPQSVTVTPAGGILVSDSGRVRLIP